MCQVSVQEQGPMRTECCILFEAQSQGRCCSAPCNKQHTCEHKFNQQRWYPLLPSAEALDVQGGSTGRLLTYSPQTGKTQVLATDVFYANGVALSQDESYLLLAETGALRILRIWLTGPKVMTCFHPTLRFTDLSQISGEGPWRAHSPEDRCHTPVPFLLAQPCIGDSRLEPGLAHHQAACLKSESYCLSSPARLFPLPMDVTPPRHCPCPYPKDF